MLPKLTFTSSIILSFQVSFNLGTGRSQQFNELAAATVNACRAAEGKPEMSLKELLKKNPIRYIPFPDALKGKYQSFITAGYYQVGRSWV